MEIQRPNILGDIQLNGTAGTNRQSLLSAGNGAQATWSSLVGSDINLLKLGNPTYYTLQDMQTLVHSAGWVYGGDITDNGNGSITVAAGKGLIRAVDSSIDPLYFADWSSTILTPTNLVETWIVVGYNAGTPIPQVIASEPTDFNTQIILARIYRKGTNLYINNSIRHTIGDHASLMMRAMQATMPFANESGGMLSSPSSRYIAVTSGIWWNGLTRFTTAAFDSSVAGTFNTYYRNGVGGWTEVNGQTLISNTQYDNGTGTLATLNNNYYTTHWVYLSVRGEIKVQYGQINVNSLSLAQDDMVPTQPTELATDSRLIGKLIIQKSATTFSQVLSSLMMSFTYAPVTDHNSLTSLQGGTVNEYYHLTSAQHSGFGAFTLTVPASGTAVIGTGASNRVAIWTGTNTLSIDNDLTYDSAANTLGLGKVQTIDGVYNSPAYTFTNDTGTGIWRLLSGDNPLVMSQAGRARYSVHGNAPLILGDGYTQINVFAPDANQDLAHGLDFSMFALGASYSGTGALAPSSATFASQFTGGLGIAAANGGSIRFYVGGLATTNEVARFDANKVLLVGKTSGLTTAAAIDTSGPINTDNNLTVGGALRSKIVLSSTDAVKVYLTKAIAANRLDLAVNAMYNGTSWIPDDATKVTSIYQQLDGAHYFWTGTAANPSVMTNTFLVSAAGDMTVNGQGIINDLTTITVTDATTNTAIDGLILQHNTSGTPAANFGSVFRMRLKSSTTNSVNVFNIQPQWVVSTHASRTARVGFYVNDSAAAREVIRIEASGTAGMIGFLGAAAITRPAPTGSRGGNAALASLLTALANLGLITDSTSA